MQRTGRTIRLEVDGGVKVDNIARDRAGRRRHVRRRRAIFGAPDYARRSRRCARSSPPCDDVAQRGSADGAPIIDVGAIAFDLDGTLLDTVHDLAAAVNALLDELGYPPLAQRRRRRADRQGHGESRAPRAGARRPTYRPRRSTTVEVKDALGRYQAHYASRLGHETRLFPGMVEGLARLAAMGIPLAVITNKATRFVRPHLVAAGIERLLRRGDRRRRPADEEARSRRRCGTPRRVFGIPTGRLLMVGDSGNDVEAARGAGCPVLVVPYGYREGQAGARARRRWYSRFGGALADRVRYVASRTAMSLDRFHSHPTAAAARGNRPLAALVRRPPLALTSRRLGVARKRRPAQSRDCPAARLEEIVEAS